MIHEAMLLEYSARHLALMEWAAALKLFNYACIGFALFVPWGVATARWQTPPALLAALPILAAQARGRGRGAGADRDGIGEAARVSRAGVPRDGVPARGARAARAAAAAELTGDVPFDLQLLNTLAARLAADRVRDAVAAARRDAREPARAPGRAARGRDAAARLAHGPEPSVRLGAAHPRAEGGIPAVAAAPADPAARRLLGQRAAAQHLGHDAARSADRDLRVRPGAADRGAREHGHAQRDRHRRGRRAARRSSR